MGKNKVLSECITANTKNIAELEQKIDLLEFRVNKLWSGSAHEAIHARESKGYVTQDETVKCVRNVPHSEARSSIPSDFF